VLVSEPGDSRKSFLIQADKEYISSKKVNCRSAMRLTLLFVITLLAVSAVAQTGRDSLWIQPFGAAGECQAAAIRQTSDCGYFLAGTESSPTGDEVLAVRLDSSGHLLWSRDYCSGRSLKVRDLRQAADGDLLIAGTTASAMADSQRSFVIRTNSKGDTSWVKVFGDTASGIHAVQPTSDGGCVLAGWEVANDSGGSDISLLKMDPWGGLVWRHRYGNPGEEWACALAAVSGGGWMIAGQGKTADGVDCLHILRTDSAGTLLWSKVFPLRGLLRVYAIEPVADGHFVIAGLRNPPSMEPCGYFLVDVSPQGETEWRKVCRADCNSAANVMLRVTPSGYLMVNHSFSLGSGTREMNLYKVDLEGQLLYHDYYSGTGYLRWELYTHNWVNETAGTIAQAIYDVFVDPHAPIAESITFQPRVPFPERSERHGPHDSFGNVYWAYFSLNHRQDVTITVYDTAGRIVRTVADGDYPSGYHCEIFDGWSLPVGIYFLRVETEALLETRKVVLVR